MADFKLSKPTDPTTTRPLGLQRMLCPVCIGRQGGECERCNGSGYLYVATYSAERAIDAPTSDELDRLRAEVKRLAAPVCCPHCGVEVERRAS